MEEKKEFNQELADLLYKKTKKDWLFNFIGVAGGVLLFLLGSIISAFTGRMMWALLTIPGMIIMALPSFVKIIKGASAKGLLDTGSIEITNVYENGYEEVDYTSTNAVNGGMAILKYGLMFFVSILLTPIALVTTTIKLVKINKAFGSAKPLLPFILDLSIVVAILIGGIIMGSAMKSGNEYVKDDYKGQNEAKAELLNNMHTFMTTHNHYSFYDGIDVSYDKETRTYTDKRSDYTYKVDIDTETVLRNGVDLSTIYSGDELKNEQFKIYVYCPMVILPFEHMLTDLDHVAMEKYNYQVRVKYVDSELGQVLFTIGTSYYQGRSENSLWSYSLTKYNAGYSFKY